ncbi:MAG: hypothetical protein IKR14_00845 [Lachnospiraceae bacterium]|nr:hypothetical protein [Lachnospiraceae bacterium]
MKNKIFAGIVLGVLILPNLLFLALRGHIDTTNRENRAYAAFPELSVSNYQNISSGLEAYYTDRLPFKNQLKRLSSGLDRIWAVGKSNYDTYYAMDTVTEGKDNWLFYTVTQADENSVTELFGRNLYSEEELAALAEQATTAQTFLENRGAQLVLLYPPSKEFVYDDYLPENIQAGMTDYPRCEQLADYLKTHTTVPVSYPKDILKQGRSLGNTYYQYDSHWNNIGAVLALQELLPLVGREAIPLTPEMLVAYSDGYPRDLLGILGTWEDVPDTYYGVYYKPEVTYETVAYYNDDYAIYSSNAGDDRTVLLLGDSFSWNLIQYLASDFQSVILATDEAKAAEFFVNNHPDIVIVETAQRKYDAQEHVLVKLEEAIRLLENQ